MCRIRTCSSCFAVVAAKIIFNCLVSMLCKPCCVVRYSALPGLASLLARPLDDLIIRMVAAVTASALGLHYRSFSYTRPPRADERGGGSAGGRESKSGSDAASSGGRLPQGKCITANQPINTPWAQLSALPRLALPFVALDDAM